MLPEVEDGWLLNGGLITDFGLMSLVLLRRTFPVQI
jgi:hypothetical protein